NAGINATNTTAQNYWSIPLSLNSNQTITAGNAGGAALYLYSAINLNDKVLTFAGAGSAQIQSGISGAGGMIKTGSGAAVLYASNTFMGNVQMLQGDLIVLNNYSLGATNGNTSVAAGASLTLSGTRTIA